MEQKHEAPSEELRSAWAMLASSPILIDNHKEEEYSFDDLYLIKDEWRARGIVETNATILCGYKQELQIVKIINKEAKAFRGSTWESGSNNKLVFEFAGMRVTVRATDSLPAWRMIIIPEKEV